MGRPAPARWPRAEKFLSDRGAARTAHPGGTLLDHLHRVTRLLSAWGADPDVQLAGLCHAAYLHQRTAGRIGSLTRLIRQAAITAISDGTERITKASLDAVQLDHLAEQHNRPTRGR
ncbi:DUF6817 domain-containing protein [Streptomyces cinerochromogenes]